MKHSILVVMLMMALLFTIGCKDKAEQAYEDFEEELKDKMAMTEQYLAPYRTNGSVVFKVLPNDASIYINDGEIGVNPKHVLIPAGTYQMKAVWPDGSSVDKKLFVLPALQAPPSFDWKFERRNKRAKSNIHFNAPLHKTEVSFIKPQ
jgi:hypothetical protein